MRDQLEKLPSYRALRMMERLKDVEATLSTRERALDEREKAVAEKVYALGELSPQTLAYVAARIDEILDACGSDVGDAKRKLLADLLADPEETRDEEVETLRAQARALPSLEEFADDYALLPPGHHVVSRYSHITENLLSMLAARSPGAPSPTCAPQNPEQRTLEVTRVTTIVTEPQG